MRDSKDRVVIITGSSSGIGGQLAIRFAKEGWKLILTYRNNVKGITDLIKQLGNRVILVEKLDLSSSKSIDSFVKKILKLNTKIDLLINNAGIGSDLISFPESKYEDMSYLFNSNLVGTMYLTNMIYHGFWKDREGIYRVINTSSIRGIDYGGGVGSVVYSASKAGINSFTKTLAKLWSPNILVNAVAPGFTYVDRYENFNKEIVDRFINQTYLKKFVNMEDLLEIYILLSCDSSITGQILYADCGFTLK